MLSPIIVLNKIDLLLAKTIQFTTVVCFSLGFLLYFMNFILIKFFHNNLTFIDPLVQYLLVIAGLLGAAWATSSDENIKIEIFKKLSKKPILIIIKNVVALVISLVILKVFGEHFLYEIKTSQKHSGIGVPNFLLDIPYIFLFLVSCFYYLSAAIQAYLPKRVENESNNL